MQNRKKHNSGNQTYFRSCSPLNIVGIEKKPFLLCTCVGSEVENCSRYFDETSHKCKAS